MPKFKAVLFDLDGTLLDTIEDLTDSMNAALARLGFPGHSVEACKQLVGEGIEHFAASALPSEQSRNEAMVARCVELMRQEYRRRWEVKTRPYDGIAELLDALTARRLGLAVLSNKADDFTRMMISRFLSQWEFAAVVGAKPGVPRKPDPAPALGVAGDLGLDPAEIIFLGDTRTDMQTARAAGMYPVGALWGFRSAEELLRSGALKLIRRPDEFLGLLKTA